MIHADTTGPVAVVTLDRPERRNALDLDALRALEDALAAARAARCRVVVLRGSGGHFCAGADLGDVEGDEFVATLRRVLVGLHGAAVPTLAAVEGAALGAGTQLAIACDLRLATPDAQFGIPAARLGLMVDRWTLRRLVAVAGESPARAMLLGAEVYSGEAAHGFGLVHRLGRPDDALDWAGAVAELAPLTIAGHKLGLGDVSDDDYHAAFVAAWGSADLEEGKAAFRARRSPRFRGS